MTPGNRERMAVALFRDILLPGGGAWPAASHVVGEFGEADRAWLVTRALAIADHAAADRVAATALLERDEPEAFRRALSELYNAYYSTAPVQEAVRLLAEAGPREASRHFDVGLTGQVVATQAGKRRM